MLDLIVLNGSFATVQPAIVGGVVLTPQIVAVSGQFPGKTVVKYKRGLFGNLIPVEVITTTESEPSKAK
jgi:hypothetical protein